MFQGHRLWIERRRYSDAYGYGVDHLRIKTIFYQSSAIEDFLVSVHGDYFRKADDELMIFHASPWSGSWYDPISRPARHWDSVILPPHIKNGLLADVKDFLSEGDRAWYAARGISHRRGYLLHGRPGSGKTTLVTAIASQLKLSVRVISPAARGMHDQKLNLVFRSCNQGDLILIEDIDCVMPMKRQNDNDDGLFEAEEKDSKNKNYLPRSTVTLSGLLNAIDGVSSQEGCILFATT
ncbi:P-loop containing nucleoside triphosphate hydrolase protein [Naematelia encephala]|uniref:p-loop containing nucleoside triphosphate hydrolase protein n=1 Tax=Naematelia encephala TaxID=71784 RepID=A0A1Y2AYW9_9TREE|nr:P-loop containing nucleoside triphosphate hydrolase protein [Naematelia encephala]